jgi:hypothetical protein
VAEAYPGVCGGVNADVFWVVLSTSCPHLFSPFQIAVETSFLDFQTPDVGLVYLQCNPRSRVSEKRGAKSTFSYRQP